MACFISNVTEALRFDEIKYMCAYVSIRCRFMLFSKILLSSYLIGCGDNFMK